MSGAHTVAPCIVVSCDTHIGPRLVDDLRPYCPTALLDEFDAFAARAADRTAALHAQMAMRDTTRFRRNHATRGHFDMRARLDDMNAEGVAAEVIFHGSQNEEPLPWGTMVVWRGPESDDPQLVSAGIEIYNRWLADAVSLEPARHVGLASLPMWDVDAAVRELARARAAGLRGVNFPAPRPGVISYNDPRWEPFWSACEELDVALATHSGAGDPSSWTGREATALISLESGGWLSRRGMHQMIFGGVFERHPRLRLVLTEQPGEWWPYALRELDSAWIAHRHTLAEQVPRPPSEYAAEHVWIGASFLAPFEAAHAVEHEYTDRVLWGSDYPHAEGTFQYGVRVDDESVGRVALRYAFAGLEDEPIEAMVGANAMSAYGFDPSALAKVAASIAAPTLTELQQPIRAIPEDGGMLSFRQFGPWA